jgi:hypothetical protein
LSIFLLSDFLFERFINSPLRLCVFFFSPTREIFPFASFAFSSFLLCVKFFPLRLCVKLLLCVLCVFPFASLRETSLLRFYLCAIAYKSLNFTIIIQPLYQFFFLLSIKKPTRYRVGFFSNNKI